MSTIHTLQMLNCVVDWPASIMIYDTPIENCLAAIKTSQVKVEVQCVPLILWEVID